MIIHSSATPLTNANVSEFENNFRIMLPQDYKEFMLTNNGGRPEKEWGFDFIETGKTSPTSSLICEFLAICTRYNSIQNAYNNLVESKEIPPGLLPIANDPGGNIILLSVAEEDYGKVCFGNHELEDPETAYIVMSPIADSFTEFINKCYECDEE
jgi:cell wall assembly regulator SMI1